MSFRKLRRDGVVDTSSKRPSSFSFDREDCKLVIGAVVAVPATGVRTREGTSCCCRHCCCCLGRTRALADEHKKKAAKRHVDDDDESRSLLMMLIFVACNSYRFSRTDSLPLAQSGYGFRRLWRRHVASGGNGAGQNCSERMEKNVSTSGVSKRNSAAHAAAAGYPPVPTIVPANQTAPGMG